MLIKVGLGTNAQMLVFTLSDHPKAKDQVFGDVKVTSHSGLSTTEIILLANIQEMRPSTKRVLICENRTGILGQVISKKLPDLEVTQHSFDHFYHQRLEDRWENSEVSFTLGDRLNEKELFDEILIQFSQSLSAEFLADMLQQAYGCLVKGGRLWVALESRHGNVFKDIKNRYGALSEVPHPKGKLIRIKKNAPLKKIKSYESEVSCRIPGKEALNIKTRPGIFAHRRVDGGAMALIKKVQLDGEEKVLEMGCGSGVVSLALKRLHPNISMYALDSHAVAVSQTGKNAESNGLHLDGLQLTSSGWKGEEQFDVLIGNPPYFGDHRLSALFIDEARRLLVSKGSLWLVAKSMSWNLEYAKDSFDLSEEFTHSDYQVVRLIKK
jgi:16S rRNA G1207 methylase RsmC